MPFTTWHSFQDQDLDRREKASLLQKDQKKGLLSIHIYILNRLNGGTCLYLPFEKLTLQWQSTPWLVLGSLWSSEQVHTLECGNTTEMTSILSQSMYKLE